MRDQRVREYVQAEMASGALWPQPITLYNQQFVPGSNRENALLPLVFRRECGQEYYAVDGVTKGGRTDVQPREELGAGLESG